MSHTVQIHVEFKDPAVLLAACQKLGWRVDENVTVKLYQTTETGTAIYIPGWKYPAVVQADGTIKADTYLGQWGNEKLLSQLKQVYAVEKTRVELRKKGLSVYEQANQDGSVTLTVNAY